MSNSFDGVSGTRPQTSISMASASATISSWPMAVASRWVVLPASLTFKTGAPEVMEAVGGSCRVRLEGAAEWRTCTTGESFQVPANSSFDIVVEGEPFHYVCHYG